MKFKHIIITTALAMALACGLRAQNTSPAPAADAPATPKVEVTGTAAQPQFTDTQVFEMLGWYLVANTPVNELEPSADQTNALLKGVRSFIDGKPAPYDAEKIRADMDRVLSARQAAYATKQKTKADAQAVEYFANLKKQKGDALKMLPSGVMYEIVKTGSGAAPTPTDTVKIHYEGTLADGTVFDSSYERNEPAEFALSRVIPGMTEGLQQINKGGTIKIYIPYAQGYGDHAMQSIPAYSTLVFKVDMIDFKPTPAAAPEAVEEGAVPPATDAKDMQDSKDDAPKK